MTRASCLHSICLLVMFTAIVLPARAQRHISILWLGNSYICDNQAGMHLNDATKLMINRAHDSGLTDIVVDSSVYNCLWSMGLAAHYYDTKSMDMLSSGNYTYVVLQGYIKTDDTATMRADATSNLEFGLFLAAEAKRVGTIPIIWCAHPRCDATPYMWQYTIDAYKKVADSAQSTFAPVSIAWRNAKAENPEFVAYQGDCIHQNKNGIYLNAAMFYTVFTGASVVGHPVTALGPSYPADTLAFMQRIVQATYDSVRTANTPVTKPVGSAAPVASSSLRARVQDGTIRFQVAGDMVGGELRVYAMDGRLVALLPVVTTMVEWQAPGVSPGAYRAVCRSAGGSRVSSAVTLPLGR